MERLTDEQLVILCLDGNSDAFAVIVERYQKQIFALAYRLGGDYDEAQDMAQESFIRVHHELHRYDTSRRFFPWMYRVAHNCCVNILQKRPRNLTPIDELSDIQISTDERSNPGASYEKLERSAAINVAMQQLPEQYRLPLALKYLEGLSYQQISEQLDLPQSTIETRLFRGRVMLRKLLSEYIGNTSK